MLKIALIVAVASVGLFSSIAGAAERRYSEGNAPTVDARAFPSLTLIYAGSGVADDGGAYNAGTATSFLCTNWTAASQTLQFVLKNFNGTVIAANSATLAAGRTFTASTHPTLALFEDAYLHTSGILINQGSFRILATAAAISCSVLVIGAAAAYPDGVDLHLVRFNPWPGGQE